MVRPERRQGRFETYESALRADKEVLEVSSSVVLSKCRHVVEDCSIREHSGQSDAIRMK